MPSLGLGEIILIGIAIIVFIRPEDLPKFIRNFSRLYAEIRRLLTKYQGYTRETLDEISQLDLTTKQTGANVSSQNSTEGSEFSANQEVDRSESTNKVSQVIDEDQNKQGLE